LGCTAGYDGVLGLTRGFLTAGAQSVVSSLWKVDDAATSILMQNFYSNLWDRNLSKSAALQEAQLAILNSPQSVKRQQQQLLVQLCQEYPDSTIESWRAHQKRTVRGIILGKTIRVDPEGEKPSSPTADPTRLPSSDTRRPHPALWAAFILNGDAR
jgi:CHAT domain-containing protein